MEGITHAEFRALMAEMGGLHLVCTEFVRVTHSPLGRAQVRRNVQKAPGVPLSVQVMGNDEERMAEAAAVIEAAGADVVDINLGCPMPRIVRKGVGAAMLKDQALLRRVLGLMRSHTRGLLSAKIRAGFDTADEVQQIADVVERSGVDFIAVHPRRRCDFYTGVADWRIITTLKRQLKIPVIGNGDVWYAKDAARMRLETGCDAVMIGRPALRNPWIFRQIAELSAGVSPFAPSGADVRAHLEKVLARYRVAFPDRRDFVGPLKEMVNWLGRALPDAAPRLRGLLRLNTEAELLLACDELFLPLSASELDLDAHGSLELERSGSALHVGVS
jgi:tRNA-dihydrouridine synthase B